MKIGFIGAGNMANAIVSGIVKTGLYKTENIYVSAKTLVKLAGYQQQGIHTSCHNQEIIDHSDIVIFAIKPQVYPEVVKEITVSDHNKIFVSLAAGISIDQVKTWLAFDAKVIRVMPNTPAKVMLGMTALSYDSPCTEQDYQKVVEVFSAVGKIQLIPEKLMNEVIAVTGSSPAYIYYLIDLMAKKAQKYGFCYEDAVTMVAQTVMGSAQMVLSDSDTPEMLKQKVCSKGGTTIAALTILEDGHFSSSIENAMDACTKRAYELGK